MEQSPENIVLDITSERTHVNGKFHSRQFSKRSKLLTEYFIIEKINNFHGKAGLPS